MFYIQLQLGPKATRMHRALDFTGFKIKPKGFKNFPVLTKSILGCRLVP